MSPQEFDVVSGVASLIDAWCERRELGALARLLPAWIGNNGLTDGWGEVWEALRTVRADCRLPEAEALMLDDAIVAIGRAVFGT